MSNPDPSPAHRWKPGQCGNGGGGRASRKWLRKIMAERNPDGQPYREAIIRHLIEVATKWEIVHLGKNYAVASGRDAVEAAKLLYAYDLGTPPKTPTQLELAEHLRQVSRDQWNVLVQALGDRFKTMSSAEIAEVVAKADLDPTRFLSAAREQMHKPLHKPLHIDTEPVPVLEGQSQEPESPSEVACHSPGGDSGGTVETGEEPEQ